MGSFICAISERDWEISRKRGIYGNKILKEKNHEEFSPTTKYSIIRDLAGMKKGDKIFFHVIKTGENSRIHGIYIVREEPFFDRERIWNDEFEIFPYRFLFEPHPEYKYLCSQDANIEVIDFYELIEQRKIWSLATLENEMNIEARSVRKIEDGKETIEILRLLHRDLRHRRSNINFTFLPYNRPNNIIPIRDCIKDIGRYENSIKALLMYKIGHNDPSIINIMGPISDFLNEVFIAQTTRKSIDILCINNHPSNSKKYIICEVKTNKCSSNSLNQVLYYMDLFKRKDLVDIYNDIIIGALIGQNFEKEIVKFSQKKNRQGVNGSIMLIKYTPIENGKDAIFERLA